jgi:hypothetical protein
MLLSHKFYLTSQIISYKRPPCPHAWDYQSATIGKCSTDYYPTPHVSILGTHYLKLNDTIVKKDDATSLYLLSKRWEIYRHRSRVTFNIASRKYQSTVPFQYRLPTLQSAGTILRARQVNQDANRHSETFTLYPYPLDNARMFLQGTMRKIQPGYIHTRPY